MGIEKESGKKEIKRPHIIVCEGVDAEKYLIYFLQPLISADSRYDQFQVIDGGGNEDLHKSIRLLPNLPNFDMIAKTLTIIRDAEANSSGANQSIQQILKKNNFAVPASPCIVASPSPDNRQVAVGYALFPGLCTCEENGTLEDLCWKTLAGDNADALREIADHAITSAQEQFGPLSRPHKNRLHTYLSLTDKFVGLKLGESAMANAYDFSARRLDPLKKLLCSMLDSEISTSPQNP